MSSMKFSFVRNFKWKILLLRIFANAVTLALVAILVPDIYFTDRSLPSLLLVAIGLGIVNALIKPVIQFLTLPFIFASYGLVLVLINGLVLWLVSVLFHNRFAVTNFWWALFGGALMGLASSFLESLLGVTPPIVPEATADAKVSQQLTPVSRLAIAINPEMGGTLARAPLPDPDSLITGDNPAAPETPR
jgi:putative membrane protein